MQYRENALEVSDKIVISVNWASQFECRGSKIAIFLDINKIFIKPLKDIFLKFKLREKEIIYLSRINYKI